MRRAWFSRTATKFSSAAHVSIIIPAYNQEDIILEFHRRLSLVLEEADMDQIHILYINAASTDRTLDLLLGIAQNDENMEIISLSHHCATETAVLAGLDHACGDAAIIMAADLQAPQELIPRMIREWQQGFDVVNMKPGAESEQILQRASAQGFPTPMGRIGQMESPENSANFVLLSQRALDRLKQMPERPQLMRELFTWAGFPVNEFDCS